jgi:shikimate kinase
MQRSIALVGLSGAGKSTVARVLGQRLRWPVHDIDAMLVAATGRPVAQLFSDEGEAAFRLREARTLAEALASGPAVVATGGGIVLREENRILLRKRATIIWLDAPDNVLIARLRASHEERPLLAGNPAATLAAMREAREPLYAELASLWIAASKHSPEKIAAQIIEQVCYNT